MAENVVNSPMQAEIILTENDVPEARLKKDLTEGNLDECRGQEKNKKSSTSGRSVKTKPSY